MSECFHKLCKAEATHSFDTRDAWDGCVFRHPGLPLPARHFELCDEHFNDYLPFGFGWIDRKNSTRMRIQCLDVPARPSWNQRTA